MIVSRKQQYSLVIILTLQAISIILVRQKSANRDLSMYGIADRLEGNRRSSCLLQAFHRPNGVQQIFC